MPEIIVNDTPKNTYTQARKEAYMRNKSKIAEREKLGKRWVEYYETNKEEIAKRRKEIRDKKKMEAVASGKPIIRKSRAAPIDESKITRYEELMTELATLKKEVSRKRRMDTWNKKLGRIEDTPEKDTPGGGLKTGDIV